MDTYLIIFVVETERKLFLWAVTDFNQLTSSSSGLLMLTAEQKQKK